MNFQRRAMSSSNKRQLATKAPKERPQWDSALTENPHKLSRAEILQRKLNVMSKNKEVAREEWQKKQEILKQGKIPKEYKPFVEKEKKKPTAKEAFIKDKGLAREYQNRCYQSSVLTTRPPPGVTTNQDFGEGILIKSETMGIQFTTAANLNWNQPPSREIEEDLGDLISLVNQPVLKTSSMVPGPTFAYEENCDNNSEEDNEREQAYDYLDFKQNEERLNQIRQQTIHFENLLNPVDRKFEPATAQAQGDDLDTYFSNLNLLLDNNRPKEQNTVFTSGITPIKREDSPPRSLLPNYAELFGQPPSAPSLKIYGLPENNDYEPFTSQQLLSPDQVFSSEQKDYLEPIPLTLTEHKWVEHRAPQIPAQSLPPISNILLEDDQQEDEQQLKRLRDMVLNTQKEIDQMFSSSSNIQQVYESSKAFSCGGGITAKNFSKEYSLCKPEPHNPLQNDRIQQKENIRPYQYVYQIDDEETPKIAPAPRPYPYGVASSSGNERAGIESVSLSRHLMHC